MNTRFVLAFWLSVLALVTSGCPPPSPDADRDSLVFGSVSVTLQDDGVLAVTGMAAGDTTIDVGLPYPETCDFVRWGDTNVAHIERYYDAWIVLVQCHRRVDQQETDPRFGCDTQYKGLIIRDDANVFLNPKSNGGSGCPPIDRDRIAFTSLAADYVQPQEP